MSDRIQFLKKTTLLSEIPRSLLAKIGLELREIQMIAHETLFREGDPADALYFIVDGELRVEKQGLRILSLLPFECVGELALIDGEPRSATVIAERETVLLRWERQHFIDVLGRSSHLARSVQELLTQRLRKEGSREVSVVMERERYRQDLRRAQEIQSAMSPKTDLLTQHVHVSGCCHPADCVGGDYLDYFSTDRGEVCLILSDAMGHGFYSALFAAMAKSCLHTQVMTDCAPKKVMEAMDRILSLALHDYRFMSCCFVVLSHERNRLIYCNAGHPPPYHFKGRGRNVEKLAATNALLGLPSCFKEAEFKYETRDWGKGDVLVLYSDGIPEARNASGKSFGYDRLREILLDSAGMAPPAIKDKILKDVADYCGQNDQGDDISLIVAQAL